VKKRVWERKIRHPNRSNPPLNERNPKNTRKSSKLTLQAKQWLFSSYSVAKPHPKNTEKPAKQQINPPNNPKQTLPKNIGGCSHFSPAPENRYHM
jgi:hypothetical protein